MEKFLRIYCPIFLIIIYLFYSHYLYSQSYKTFEEEKQHIQSVTDRIWQTIDFPFPKPKIILNKLHVDTSNIDNFFRTTACRVPKTDSIYIGIDIYDICMTIGEEALAVILSHEIGHYINNHTDYATVSGYIISPKESDFIKSKIKKGDFDQLKGPETQADIFAAFHCYSAGYDISSAMPKILEKIYEYCKTPKKSLYYIPLNERQTIAKNARDKLIELIPLFEAAVYLKLIGKPSISTYCFDLIIENNYITWEIYNNAGVCYTQYYLQWLNWANENDKRLNKDIENNKKFIYPLILELNSMLTKLEDLPAINTKSHPFGNEISGSSEGVEIFGKAELRFDKAMNMFQKSAILFINLACYFEIEGNNQLARSYAVFAEDIANDTFTRDLSYVIKGIIFCSEKDTIAAKEEFNKAKNSILAKYNLMILNGENTFKSIVTSSNNDIKEKIADIDLLNFNNKLEFNSSHFTKNKTDSLTVFTSYGNEYKAMKIEFNHGSKKGIVLIIETKDIYKDSTSRGVKINNSSKMVFERYGSPENIQVNSGYEYMVYEKLGIIFRIKSGIVASWMLFNFSFN